MQFSTQIMAKNRLLWKLKGLRPPVSEFLSPHLVKKSIFTALLSARNFHQVSGSALRKVLDCYVEHYLEHLLAGRARYRTRRHVDLLFVSRHALVSRKVHRFKLSAAFVHFFFLFGKATVRSRTRQTKQHSKTQLPQAVS